MDLESRTSAPSVTTRTGLKMRYRRRFICDQFEKFMLPLIFQTMTARKVSSI